VTSSTNRDSATWRYRLLIAHDVTMVQLSSSLFIARIAAALLGVNFGYYGSRSQNPANSAPGGLLARAELLVRVICCHFSRIRIFAFYTRPPHWTSDDVKLAYLMKYCRCRADVAVLLPWFVSLRWCVVLATSMSGMIKYGSHSTHYRSFQRQIVKRTLVSITTRAELPPR